MSKQHFHLIESEQEYKKAIARYEEVKRALKGSEDHKEKLLLVYLISHYEKKQWDLPEADIEELIKIWKEDFGKND